MSLFYRAEGDEDWNEAAIVLHRVTLEEDDDPIVDVHVVRGQSIQNFKTKTFEIPADGFSFAAFYSGIYDRTG